MNLRHRLLAEFLGAGGLVAVVVGSGIMGESLSGGNAALALLANSISTGAGLYALIQTFGGVSGAHFNPAVSLAEWMWGRLSRRELVFYSAAQVTGAVIGVWVAHAMFAQEIFQLSAHDRGGPRFLFSEFIGTVGLILVIGLAGKRNVEAKPMAVALYIASAYWFTSSTSFANPAVTIARSLTGTFAGIQWTGVPGFSMAQILGALSAVFLVNWMGRSIR